MEVRDTYQPIYTLRQEGPIFPIVFKGREFVPPHEDPLVIMVKIAHCEVWRVLVDNGNIIIFVDIIRLSVSIKEDIILTNFVVLNTPT